MTFIFTINGLQLTKIRPIKIGRIIIPMDCKSSLTKSESVSKWCLFKIVHFNDPIVNGHRHTVRAVYNPGRDK